MVGFNGLYNEKVYAGRPYQGVLIIFMASVFSCVDGICGSSSGGLGFGVVLMNWVLFASFFDGYGMISAGFIVYAAVNNLFFIIQSNFIN